MRVTVLTGGASAERDVAFASAVQIVAALRSRGHSVAVVDTVTGSLSPQQEQQVLRGSVGHYTFVSSVLTASARGWSHTWTRPACAMIGAAVSSATLHSSGCITG